MKVIWKYHTTISQTTPLLLPFKTQQCLCCGEPFRLDRRTLEERARYTHYTGALICAFCGWWLMFDEYWDSSCGTSPNTIHIVQGAGAALESFSDIISDVDMLTLRAEIEAHLRAGGKSTAWKSMEDATTSILRDFGYHVVSTGRAKDGGIDAIIATSAGDQMYAQVKHSKNKIGVRTLRELIGTMVIKGQNKGLLVTSSRFTKGVAVESGLAAQQNFPVELVDGQKFLKALNVTRRDVAPDYEEIRSVIGQTAEFIREEVVL